LLVAADGGRETFQFTDVPADEPGMWRWVEAALVDWWAGTALPFATRDQRTGEVVGSTRYGNVEYWRWPAGIEHQHGLHLPDAVEIGWTWLAPKAQRTGINVEAKLLMLQHAFEGWRVRRVSLRADARNERSRAAIVGIGARLDGVKRADLVANDGSIQDTALYSILDSEWPSTRAQLIRRLESH
jgi:N-acetyltransferase